jgi:hypothetical protein
VKWAKDLFYGPDGETLHLGRCGSVPMFFSGLTLPWVQLFRSGSIDYASTMVGYTALAGAVWVLVQGAKNMDIMPGTPPPANPAPGGKPTGAPTP